MAGPEEAGTCFVPLLPFVDSAQQFPQCPAGAVDVASHSQQGPKPMLASPVTTPPNQLPGCQQELASQ